MGVSCCSVFGRVRTSYLLLILSVLAVACRQNQPPSERPEEGLPFDRPLARLAERDSFSGSVLVALPDTIFEMSYRAKGAPESMYTASNFRYPIGEVAQLLLRAAYFRLADQGRLQLNASVAQYLPNLPGAGKINYRMLLDHRSGLPDRLSDSKARLADLELIATPGTEEHFSSLGYHLLADALARILGTSVSNAIRTVVTEPAGMSQTGPLDPAAPVGNLAVGHTATAGSFLRVPFGEWSPAFSARDARGTLQGLPEYYSTIADLFYLAQWMPASGYLRGELKQPGVRPGYRSYFYASLEPELTTVMLSNLETINVPKVGGLLRGGALEVLQNPAPAVGSPAPQ